MKEDVAKRLVEDLRDPKNKQARSVLFNGEGYCCLGRLVIVTGKTFTYDLFNRFFVSGTSETDLAPLSVCVDAGLASEEGHPRDSMPIVVGGREYFSLVDANDAGCTFAEIADAIERDWRRL